jgi:succinate-semialdehyde dehydrogenase/glutarate-semialdehyde dehydrogenase
MNLSDRSLLKSSAYINGEWTAGDSAETFSVLDPATQAVLGRVPDMGEAETRRAIEAASAAWPQWRAKLAAERSAILHRWHDLVLQNVGDLATIITCEMGKPLTEATDEVRYGASFIEWFAEEARRVYGEVIPSHRQGARLLTLKQPVGVVAAVTPWNFPNAMIARKAAPALAAGCTVIVKPSEETPLSALALAELAERAGIPAGVFNIVTGKNPATIGAELTGNPLVRKVSFTGSTAVGKMLMQQSAGTVKKISLELGGNAPFIVFADADIDAAVDGALVCKYRSAGQTCVCANRLYIHDSVHDEFAEKFVAAVRKLKIGPGLSGANIGPLINREAVNKVQRLVDDAVRHGARIATGGAPSDIGGNFYQPTVLTEMTMSMACSQEEIFGPVSPLYRFAHEAEVIQMANDTCYGLAAYFYARDIGRIWRVAEALEYGIVGINTGLISTAVAPFGGVKESGIGREGSKYGLEEFLETKYLCMAL